MRAVLILLFLAILVCLSPLFAQTASVRGQILQGIVNSIPQNAFQEPRRCKYEDTDELRERDFCQNYASIEKNVLNHGVTEVQKLLNSKHPDTAIGLLRELIEEIKHFTSSDYPVTDSSELTQQEVVLQIQQIIESLEKRCADDKKRK